MRNAAWNQDERARAAAITPAAYRKLHAAIQHVISFLAILVTMRGRLTRTRRQSPFHKRKSSTGSGSDRFKEDLAAASRQKFPLTRLEHNRFFFHGGLSLKRQIGVPV